jgi:hypothetical protein
VVLPYANPFSNAFRFNSRKAAGTESATAFAHTIRAKKLRDSREESDHHRVQHHAFTQFLGEARRWNAIDLFVSIEVGDSHQIFFNDHQAARL